MQRLLHLFSLLLLILNLAGCGSGSSTPGPVPGTPPNTNQSTLSVTLLGNGSGTMTSNPPGLVCTPTSCAGSFSNGTTITLTAVPTSGHSFGGWIGSGCTGTGSCTLTLTSPLIISATFNAPVTNPVITITKTGTGTGIVTSSIGGITCGATCVSAPIPGGSAITLTALADPGMTFTGWSGTGCAGTAPCTLTPTANTVITATFSPIVTTPSLTITLAGTGQGTVTSTPSGLSCPGTCTSTFGSGSIVTLNASPNPGTIFTGWSGACTGTGPCVVTLNGNTTVTATFTTTTVTIHKIGSGLVTSSPTGISCDPTCTAAFSPGTTITLTATSTGSPFTGWNGAGCSGTGPCTFTLSANTVVTASFGTTSSSTSYHFLREFDPTGGTPRILLAIDPTNPTAPVTVHTAARDANMMVEGTWDPALAQFTQLHQSHVIYVANGSLWRVQASTTAGIPGSASNPAVQISSENGLTSSLCTLQTIPAIPQSHSLIIYEQAGADGNCATAADNLTKYTTLLATSSTTPITIGTGNKALLTPAVYNLITGDVDHLLFMNSSSNQLVDHQISTTVSTAIPGTLTGRPDTIAQPTTDRVFLASTSQALVYTPSTHTLTTLLTAAPGRALIQAAFTSSDGTHVYLAQNNGTFYRWPVTTTSPADVSTVLTTGETITSWVLTANRISYILGTPATGDSLKSFLKTGAASSTTIRTGTANEFVSLFDTNGPNLYYTVFTSTGASSAGIISEAGIAIATYTNHTWIGGRNSPTYDPKVNDVGTTPAALIFENTATGPTGGSIKEVLPNTPTTTRLVGTLPTTTAVAFPPVFLNAYGSSFLGTTLQASGVNTIPFFVDTDTNTVVQVPVLPGTYGLVF